MQKKYVISMMAKIYRLSKYVLILDKSITKVRSRQRVEPAAVQPIVIRTAYWAGIGKYEK